MSNLRVSLCLYVYVCRSIQHYLQSFNLFFTVGDGKCEEKEGFNFCLALRHASFSHGSRKKGAMLWWLNKEGVEFYSISILEVGGREVLYKK